MRHNCCRQNAGTKFEKSWAKSVFQHVWVAWETKLFVFSWEFQFRSKVDRKLRRHWDLWLPCVRSCGNECIRRFAVAKRLRCWRYLHELFRFIKLFMEMPSITNLLREAITLLGWLINHSFCDPSTSQLLTSVRNPQADVWREGRRSGKTFSPAPVWQKCVDFLWTS